MKNRHETGVIKKPWGSNVPIALVYPNSYRVGMGNLGYQYLYRHINSIEGLLAERFFFSHSGRQDDGGSATPVSEESGRPLRDFSVIAFSIPFENDYPGVPGALMAGGVSPLRSDRNDDDPIVICGGVAPSINPEPLSSFFDVIFVGEVDDSLGDYEFFRALACRIPNYSSEFGDKQSFVDSLCDIPGVYAPSGYEFQRDVSGRISKVTTRPGFPKRVKAVKRQSSQSVVPGSVIFSSEAEFGEILLIEINRGCGRRCRFCTSGWIHGPVRYVDPSRFEEALTEAVSSGRKVGLIGSDLAGYPHLDILLKRIVDGNGAFSLSSIRPEALNENMLGLIARSGQKTVTLAPEAASVRMKRIIGKEIANDVFYRLVKMIVSAGIPSVRFYFMVGLPLETDADVMEIVDFVKRSREGFVDASRPKGRIGTIGVQVNPFVPKPWTPFQWVGMTPVKDIERRISIIRDGLKGVPNIVFRSESVKSALIQAFLARSDKLAAGAILEVAGDSGKWNRVLRNIKDQLNFFVYRRRDEGEVFPWEITDHGISRQVLKKSLEKVDFTSSELGLQGGLQNY
jgi:radical SAM superfamily enzyme YgiQ (UPF0313 family)